MANAHPCRILVVDDDPVCRRFLDEVLVAQGHATMLCGSVAEALACAGAQGFDLVLTDLRLPDRSGQELFARLRADPALPNHATPVVALSGELSPRLRAALREQGFAAAIEKPLTAVALVRLLADLSPSPDAAGNPVGHADGAHSRDHDAEALPDLDDESALAATGSVEILAGLRALFRDELPRQLENVELALASRDDGNARETLHRLRASCGFCGALALRDTADRLALALAGAKADRHAAEKDFLRAAQRCLARLA